MNVIFKLHANPVTSAIYVYLKILFVLMRKTHFLNLSKQFRNTLYIKNSWELGDEDFILTKVGEAKMHNVILHDYRNC